MNPVFTQKGLIPVAALSIILLTQTGCAVLKNLKAPKTTQPVQTEEPTAATNEPIQKQEELMDEIRHETKKAPKKLYEWHHNGPFTRIVVNTTEQHAYFFNGKELAGWTTVATGLRAHPTPTGNFKVIGKKEMHMSNLYGSYVKNGKVLGSTDRIKTPPAGAAFSGAKMPYFIRLTNDGIGFHSGRVPHPGRPASHGCIRIPPALAPKVFKAVAIGTPVVIEGQGPTYAQYLKTRRTPTPTTARAASSPKPAESTSASATAATTSAATTTQAQTSQTSTATPAADNKPATTPTSETSTTTPPEAQPATTAPAEKPSAPAEATPAKPAAETATQPAPAESASEAKPAPAPAPAVKPANETSAAPAPASETPATPAPASETPATPAPANKPATTETEKQPASAPANKDKPAPEAEKKAE